jgi:3D (Asp-Asp-Asp) domain-containing protein
MANGLYPKKGYVATSDRTIPFGTKIEIDGVEYEVGDRTNKRFQHFKNQTIDIFWEESEESCLKFGTSLKNIIIKQ